MGAVANAVKRVKQAVGDSSDDTYEEESHQRWLSVTIYRGQEVVMPNGALPAPLAALGDLIEVQTRPAPGDKGTELSARLRVPEPKGHGSALSKEDDDPRQKVRSALREAKQLIEVGEVLRVDPVPHGHRKATPTGKLVDRATENANKEGVL